MAAIEDDPIGVEGEVELGRGRNQALAGLGPGVHSVRSRDREMRPEGPLLEGPAAGRQLGGHGGREAAEDLGAGANPEPQGSWPGRVWERPGPTDPDLEGPFDD